MRCWTDDLRRHDRVPPPHRAFLARLPRPEAQLDDAPRGRGVGGAIGATIVALVALACAVVLALAWALLRGISS